MGPCKTAHFASFTLVLCSVFSTVTSHTGAFTSNPVCPVGYIFKDELCYKVHSEELTWDQARKSCEKEKTRLVDLTSEKQVDALNYLKNSTKYYWVNNKSESCESIYRSNGDDYEWVVNGTEFTIRSHVLIPSGKDPCCLSLNSNWPYEKRKFLWTACTDSYYYICGILQKEVTQEMLEQNLMDAVEKCRNSYMNSTDFEQQVGRLEAVLYKLSRFHSHLSQNVTIGVSYLWLTVLTSYLIWNYFYDKRHSGEFTAEMVKNGNQNFYEPASEYATYACSPSVMDSTERS